MALSTSSWLRNLSVDIKRYYLSSMCMWGAVGIWSLLLNLYFVSMGMDAAFIGLYSTLAAVASMTCSLPAGILADRIGRKRAMLIGFVGMASTYLGVSLAHSRATIILAGMLFGILGPFFYISAAPFLTQESEPHDRVRLFTLDSIVANLVLFVSSIVGGSLPNLYSGLLGVGAESPQAYRGALLTAAAVMALGIVPLLGLSEKGSGAGSHTRVGAACAIRDRFSNPRLLLKLVMPMILIAVGSGFVVPFMNLFMKDRFGVTDATLGWVFGLTSVVSAIIVLLGLPVAERRGNVPITLASRALSVPLLLVVGYAPYFPVVIVAYWLRTGLMNLAGPLYLAFAMEQLSESQRAIGSSLLSMCWDLGWAVGPFFSGRLQLSSGFGLVFNIASALCAVGTISLWWFFTDRRSPARAAPLT
ncbi:MAG: MFS transporter [Chloroflexi bacterium]|nr:MFS transporter [Chloroflexota bacterium]